MRIDGECEYILKAFEAFCVDPDLRHGVTTLYTPQDNGLCERRNKTILVMTR